MAAKTILDRIMLNKREELPKRKRAVPESDLRASLMLVPPPRDLQGALRQPGLPLIAECVRALPTRGLLRNGYDAAVLARDFERGGAAAISVVTDAKFFQGRIEDLVAVRQATTLPIIRSDFIFDPYQLVEARAGGADGVLLIAALLQGNRLRDMRLECERLGMQALVEVHDEAELAHALDAGAAILVITQRDLHSFEVDSGRFERLRPLVPPGPLVVAKHAAASRADARPLEALGADALYGDERLVTAKEPARAVRALVG